MHAGHRDSAPAQSTACRLPPESASQQRKERVGRRCGRRRRSHPEDVQLCITAVQGGGAVPPPFFLRPTPNFRPCGGRTIALVKRTPETFSSPLPHTFFFFFTFIFPPLSLHTYF